MVCVLLVLLCSLLAVSASYAEVGPFVRLRTAFSPNRPNASTTVHFGFSVTSPFGRVPPPLASVSVRLPAGMGLGLTNLGEAVCLASVLERGGMDACPSKSLMGVGHAVAELMVGDEILSGPLDVRLFMGARVHEHTGLLFDVVSMTPIEAQFIFQGELGAEPGSTNTGIKTVMPLIPTWPEGPTVSVVNMESTLGPEHITYYSHRYGRQVAYHPTGMAVPARCPAGGFRFAASFLFQNGTRTTASSTVPCPA